MLRATWAFVLFTLQSKQQVINILLIVFLWLHLIRVFSFFETVGSHLARLTLGDSFVDVALCPPRMCNKRGELSDSLFTSIHDTYKARARQ